MSSQIKPRIYKIYRYNIDAWIWVCKSKEHVDAYIDHFGCITFMQGARNAYLLWLELSEASRLD